MLTATRASPGSPHSGDAMDSPEAPSVIQQLLQRVDAVNRRAGFMTWDPEKIAVEDALNKPNREKC
jgi:hypothetical protein